MKSNKTITLSLSDLKELGIIPRRNKRKKTKKSKRKVVYIDAKSGAVIGGLKSDSSQMTGYGMTLPSNPVGLTNTSNISSMMQQTQLQQMEENMRKDKIRNQLALENGTPDSNPVITDRFTQLLNPLFNNINKQIEDRFSKIEDKQNNLEDITQDHTQAIQDGMDWAKNNFNKLNESKSFVNLDDDAGNFNGTQGSDYFLNAGKDTPIEMPINTPINNNNTTGYDELIDLYDNNNNTEESQDDSTASDINFSIRSPIFSNKRMSTWANVMSPIFKPKIGNANSIIPVNPSLVMDTNIHNNSIAEPMVETPSITPPPKEDKFTSEKKAYQFDELPKTVTELPNKKITDTLRDEYKALGGTDEKILKSKNFLQVKKAVNDLKKDNK